MIKKRMHRYGMCRSWFGGGGENRVQYLAFFLNFSYNFRFKHFASLPKFWIRSASDGNGNLTNSLPPPKKPLCRPFLANHGCPPPILVSDQWGIHNISKKKNQKKNPRHLTDRRCTDLIPHFYSVSEV